MIALETIARETTFGAGWREWLPDMDLNHDKQIQSLLCYRYTIGQTGVVKIESRVRESSRRLAIARREEETSYIS
jgi:hypothetical protein